MPFSIAFLNEPLFYPYDDPTVPAALGLLSLGNAIETFTSSLSEWGKRDYESQWRNALSSLLATGSKTALITTYGNPQTSSHLEWWPMFKVGDTVIFQDQLLFYENLVRPFTVEDAFSFLGDRSIQNDEGKAISEWRVALSEVEAFVCGWPAGGKQIER